MSVYSIRRQHTYRPVIKPTDLFIKQPRSLQDVRITMLHRMDHVHPNLQRPSTAAMLLLLPTDAVVMNCKFVKNYIYC